LEAGIALCTRNLGKGENILRREMSEGVVRYEAGHAPRDKAMK